MADQDRKRQSGDGNLDYVAKHDKPQQDHRDKVIADGEEKMYEASKRDEGIR